MDFTTIPLAIKNWVRRLTTETNFRGYVQAVEVTLEDPSKNQYEVIFWHPRFTDLSEVYEKPPRSLERTYATTWEDRDNQYKTGITLKLKRP